MELRACGNSKSWHKTDIFLVIPTKDPGGILDCKRTGDPTAGLKNGVPIRT